MSASKRFKAWLPRLTLVLGAALTACQTEVRERVCDAVAPLPAQLLGRYRLTMPDTSEAYGRIVSFSDAVVEIAERDGRVLIGVDARTAGALSAAGSVLSLPAFALCEIGGTLYGESTTEQ